MRTLRFAIVIAMLVSLFGVVGIAGGRPASAASQSGHPVALVYDCAAMEAGTALQQARARAVCPSRQGNAAPNDIVSGDCGTASFWLFNAAGGQATFYLYLEPNEASVEDGHWYASWTNWSTSGNGSADGDIYQAYDGWDGEGSELVYTGVGWVTAAIDTDLSWVGLEDGTICLLLPNSDGVNVTG